MNYICSKPSNNRISLSTNDEQFFLKITAGQAETFLTVGYSSPNYADIIDLDDEQQQSFISQCEKVLETIVEQDLDLMPNVLYLKLKEINDIYNSFIVF